MASHIRRSGRLLAAALLAAAAPIAVAQAQDRNLDSEVSTGKVFRGESAEDAPARFVISQDAGQALEVTASPVNGSDPFLKVYDADSGVLIAENDDSAGSLASSVRLFSPSARRLRIEVSNAAGGDGIRFDLIVRPSDYRPNPVKEVALGQSISGTLSSGDEQLFRFRAERGQLWEFAMSPATGSELDPALAIYAGERAAGQVLASDDDGAGGLNARVRFLAPAAGTYVVRGYGVGSSEGDYVLTAGRGRAAAVTDSAEIDLGRPANGTIDSGTSERVYRLSAAARTALAGSPGPLVIDLQGTGEGEGALDPVLEVGFETPLGFASLAEDDDGGEDSNSRIVLDASGLTPAWLDALRIKAGGFLDTEGDYALTVGTGSDE